MYTGIKKIFQTARTESVDLGYNDISEHYFQMAILLQLDSRSTSCRYVGYDHYTLPSDTIPHCWEIGDFSQGMVAIADLQYKEKRVRKQLWRNRRENSTQGVYIRLVTV